MRNFNDSFVLNQDFDDVNCKYIFYINLGGDWNEVPQMWNRDGTWMHSG